MNSLLKQANQLQNKIDQKLLNYSNITNQLEQDFIYSSSYTSSSLSSDEIFKKLTNEIEELLEELKSINIQMKNLINENDTEINSSMYYQVEQFEKAYGNYKREFLQIKEKLVEKINRKLLLQEEENEEENNDRDYSDRSVSPSLSSRYVSDTQRLIDANRRTQEMLEQGRASKSALSEQMEMFEKFNETLFHIGCKLFI
ncbi:hypothetical protein ABK040_004702 [Willaertia magna]